MNCIVKWAVVAGAVLMAGCGGAAATEESELPVEASEEAELRPASCVPGALTEITYYRDATKTEEVGRQDCLCNGTIIRGGVVSPHVSIWTYGCLR
ncbi:MULTISPECIES: hypothetical protein [Myxococcus]|uniref:hypothetical protein n=1 Tax=Myxococcus TaxID=32 RepID=UPI0013D7D93A|nr:MULTISPECIES: hypothetical protein [Myxococcus]NVJ19995.1 hypothetical protein [Myxococcus sp. AM011]